jgi:hypothetical protein
MRHLLILYPHWPPSNLSGTHRARLTANFATDAGWRVSVICVHEDFYEDPLDEELNDLVRDGVSVIKTQAAGVLKIGPYRLIGDIGLRGGYHMLKEAWCFLKQDQVDFIWIPIPSWYTSLLGPVLHRRFRVPFGIDYIDPWVYQLTAYEKRWSRAWVTHHVAKVLEPFAIRRAALVSGVAESYFAPALRRVFKDGKCPVTVAMPYGFDSYDHLVEPKNPEFPFDPSQGPYILYAGAFLPHSEVFARALFAELKELNDAGIWPNELKFQFVGTGRRPGVSIRQLARQMKIGHIVEEHPERIPFLTVQSLLRRARGSLILGSTEAHYTASKTFQCLLANKPILVILHRESTALEFLNSCNAGVFSVPWSQEDGFHKCVRSALESFIASPVSDWKPDLTAIDQYSARHSTDQLLRAISTLLS